MRRPAKVLAEILNRASVGLQGKRLVIRKIVFEFTVLPHTDGAGRRVSPGIEPCFRPQSGLL
jgi:hypothetical protein